MKFSTPCIEMKASLFWFLVLAALLPIKSQCTDGEVEKDGSCGVPGHSGEIESSKNMDDVSEDMHVELLQRDLRMSDGKKKLETTRADTVTVEPWDCGVHTAYQSTTHWDNSWTKFKKMNLSTGEYGEEEDVDLTAISPDKIRSMNSCAVNPMDGILYCSMEIYKANGNGGGSFLVAIDRNDNIGYVSKLLGFRYAATFDRDDYYVSGEKSLSVVKGVKALPKYKTYDNLKDLTEIVGLDLYGDTHSYMELGADYAAINASWESTGDFTYLVTVKNDLLLVIRLHGETPYKLWILQTNLKNGPSGKRVWGSAWNFDGVTYFSTDDGLGLWSLVRESVKLDPSGYGGTATFLNRGPAQRIDWNDGFTCGDPIERRNDPVDCDHDKYQSTSTGKVNEVDGTNKIGHLKDGKFVEDYVIDTDKMASMNACAVMPSKDPKKRKAYCMVQLTVGAWLATVGKQGVGFVQEAPEQYCFAAVFDPAGNYWVWCGKNTQKLYLIPDLETKKELADYDSNTAKKAPPEGQRTYSEFTSDPPYGENEVGADFVAYEDTKNKKTYLVSIPAYSGDPKVVSLIDITEPSKPGPPKLIKTTGLPDVSAAHGSKNTWGSAWSTPNGIFFSRDVEDEDVKHSDVWKMTLDIEKSEASFQEKGKIDAAAWHDGFSCIENIEGISVE